MFIYYKRQLLVTTVCSHIYCRFVHMLETIAVKVIYNTKIVDSKRYKWMKFTWLIVIVIATVLIATLYYQLIIPRILFLLNVIWTCKISIEMRVYVNLHFSYPPFYLPFSVSLAIGMIRYQLYGIISLAVMFAAVYTFYLPCTWKCLKMFYSKIIIRLRIFMYCAKWRCKPTCNTHNLQKYIKYLKYNILYIIT